MDPFLFASQERSNWVSTKEPSIGMTYRLPSAEILDSIFTLRYYDMGVSEEDLPNGMKCNSNIGRIIDKEKFAGDRVFSIKRNVSHWSRQNADGWDILLLVEPPVGKYIRVKQNEGADYDVVKCKNRPYQGGYVDFSPWWSGGTLDKLPDGATEQPPRNSMLDDIAFYWTKKATQRQISDALSDPRHTSIFVKKIVASIWNVQIEYIWKTLNKLDRSLLHFERLDVSEAELLLNLAQTLANANLWRRRLSWYSESLELNLQSLGICADLKISRVPAKDNPEDEADFLAVLQRWRACGKRLDSLIQVLLGTLSVLSGRLSISEAKLVSKLTWLGLIFLPLAFATNILSLTGDFRPGAAHFWVYFAVAIPMLCLVLFAAVLISWISRRSSRKLQSLNPFSNLSGTHSHLPKKSVHAV